MPATTTRNTEYIPIPLATISLSGVANFSLYIRDNSSNSIHLYRDSSLLLDGADLQRLKDRGVKHLYITADAHLVYQQYLRNNFAAILDDDSLPISRRLDCLSEAVRDVLSEAFAQRNIEDTLESVKQLALQTVDLICHTDTTAQQLLKVLRHDYHTFTHSTNVAFYCVLLAKACGTTERCELEQIATGGLLHDIGKLDIPEQVLTKNGRLNSEEWELIRRHPTTGFRLLANHTDFSFGQLMMVYQHHEKMDGSGYPVGITQSRIHPWAQICGIVDVFEALTSHRPYRSAMSRSEATSILERQAGSRFNAEIWQCWKKIIQHS